jgi:hypothetical protein
MFLDNGPVDFALQEWIDCRDFYLQTSQKPGLPENLVFACRHRARFAAENIRRVTREIEGWEVAWDLPAYENEMFKKRDEANE